MDLVAAGDYYLEVRDGNDDANAPEPYTLSLVFTPSLDTHEPNNSLGMATEVTANQSWRATILPKGDSDWYRFTVDRQGEFRVAADERARQSRRADPGVERRRPAAQ